MLSTGVILIFILHMSRIRGQNLSLSPESPAMVREGQPLVLTCQAIYPFGLYRMFFMNGSNQVNYGIAAVSLKSCENKTVNHLECVFGRDMLTLRLTLIDPVHNQTVYCLGGSETIGVKIFVQVPVKKVTLSPSSKGEVNEKENVTFSCITSTARPTANITWYKDDVVIDGGFIISNAIDMKEAVTSNITLSFQRTDSGKKIYCSAVNINGQTAVNSSNVILNITYAPSHVPSLNVDTQEVDEGKNITLQCSLPTLGNPPVKWSWVCGDDTLSEGVINTDTQSKLTLTAQRKYNQKECYCIATSPKQSLSYRGTSESKTITVYYAPSNVPTLYVDTQEVDEGKNITLQCSLPTVGNPPVKWSWVCGDDTLSEGVINTDTQSKLTLTAQRKYNQKECYCIATSPKQSLSYRGTSGSKTITVYYAPVNAPKLEIKPATVNEEEPIYLQCSLTFEGNPPVTWSWVCGDDIFYEGTQSNFTLTAQPKYNQKECHCRAISPRQSLSYNRTSGTKTITVYYNNAISSKWNETYSIKEHESFQLVCEVDGNPLSNITWLFVRNDSVIKKRYDTKKSILDISSANCLDYGNYTVLADNGKGPQAIKSANLLVNCKPRLYTTDSPIPVKIGIGNNESLQIFVRVLLFPPAIQTTWTFSGKTTESKLIKNSTDGYRIILVNGDVEQNITLYKANVSTEDFGNFTLKVENKIGDFTRIYHVDSTRSPLKPTNFTVICENSMYIKLSWISNFNGGDDQSFKISYSTDEYLAESYKVLKTNIRDEGYGKSHSYMPNIELQGALWFTITASNKFGNTTPDAIHCNAVKKDTPSSSNLPIIAGAATGGLIFAGLVIIGIVFYLRKMNESGAKKKDIRQSETILTEDRESDEDDGLKENKLYVSAGPRDDEKSGMSGTAVYAEVNKKGPASDSNANVYAEVQKSGMTAKDKVALYSDTRKPKKGLFKKEEKPKQKKAKKMKQNKEVTDVYENPEGIVMTQNLDNVYSNTTESNGTKREKHGYKNQDGLLYVEVQFDQKQDSGKPVIHGEDEKTDYATVEFPFPSSGNDDKTRAEK